MKIKARLSDLSAALGLAEKVAISKDVPDILFYPSNAGSVKGIQVWATDLLTFAKLYVPALVAGDKESFLVASSDICRYVGAWGSEGEVLLTVNGNHAIIKCNNDKVELVLKQEADQFIENFPTKIKLKGDRIVITGFEEALSVLGKIPCDQNKGSQATNQALYGINLNIAKTSVSVSATDGYQYVMFFLPAKGIKNSGSFTVEKSIANCVSYARYDNAAIYPADGFLHYTGGGNAVISTALINEEFPDLDKAIALKRVAQVSMDTKIMKAVINKASFVNSRLTFENTAKGLHLSATDGDRVYSTYVEAEVKGKLPVISIELRHLEMFCNLFDTFQMTTGAAEETVWWQNEHVRYVAMPYRVG